MRAAIFDLDGTILDSMNVWNDIDVRFAKKHNLDCDEEFFRNLSKLSFDECVKYVRSLFDIPISDEEMKKEWENMAIDMYKYEIQPKPHVVDLIVKLNEMNVKMGIATSSYSKLYRPALERIGILDMFHSFTETSEVSSGKRSPDIYLREAEKLGVRPDECVVFEDILTAVTTAKNAGFFTIAIEDRQSEADREKIKKTADMYYSDFGDIDIERLFNGEKK